MNKLNSIHQLRTVNRGFIFTVFAASIFIVLGCTACSTPSNPPAPAVSLAQSTITAEQASETSAIDPNFATNLTALLQQVATNEGLPLPILEAGFQDTKTIQSIKKLVLPPSKEFKKNWAAYRLRFIEPVRLKAAKVFWEQNRDFLSQTEASTGVPAPLIVAIIGIETIYGRQLGAPNWRP